MSDIEKPIATTAQRLKEALEHRHMTAAELCRRTGISSASMSQYVKGKVSPKQDRIYIMAVHLRCRPAWLMGYDIDSGFGSWLQGSKYYEKLRQIENNPNCIAQEMTNITDELPYYRQSDKFSKIHKMFRRVDAETQQAMLDRVQELYDLYQFRKDKKKESEES